MAKGVGYMAAEIVSINSPSGEGGGEEAYVLFGLVKLSKLISRIINPFIEPARLQNRT